jgi:hypothetical protein
MAKKPELLEKAKKLKLDVTHKNTIAEIEAAIKQPKRLLNLKRSQKSKKKPP